MNPVLIERHPVYNSLCIKRACFIGILYSRVFVEHSFLEGCTNRKGRLSHFRSFTCSGNPRRRGSSLFNINQLRLPDRISFALISPRVTFYANEGTWRYIFIRFLSSLSFLEATRYCVSRRNYPWGGICEMILRRDLKLQ